MKQVFVTSDQTIIRDKVWVHDIEVTPNCFIDVFENAIDNTIYVYFDLSDLAAYESQIKDIIADVYESYNIIFFNTIGKLQQWMTNSGELYVGYNSYEFDNCLLMWMFQHQTLYTQNKNLFFKELWQTANSFINESGSNSAYKKNIPFNAYDLMRVGNLKALFKSLKMTGANLRHPNIKELKSYIGKQLVLEDIQEWVQYNKNDLSTTKTLLNGIPQEWHSICTPPSASKGLFPAIELRYQLGKEYQVGLLDETDSGMGNKLNNKEYEKYSGIRYRDFKDKRTGYDTLAYADIIFPHIVFESQELQEFLQHLKTLTIDVRSICRGNELYDIDTVKFRKLTKKELTFKRIFCELPITFGTGGLHSNQPPQIFKSNENRSLYDLDV